VVEAIEPRPEDRFLEIGPGPGILTERLAPRVASLTAVEIDRDLAAALTRRLPPNVQIVAADFLEFDLQPVVAQGPLRIAGNLPYNVSSPILFKLLDVSAAAPQVTDATLMLQREVAERLVARVGTRDYGVLTLLTALHADVRSLLALPPGAFRPMPKVHSTLVRLDFRPSSVSEQLRLEVTRLIRVIFTQRRKTLLNALRPYADGHGRSAASALSAAGLDPSRRPETLALDEALRLASVFSAEP
jgi:16S rRNA (adenine1518-N6/adenine1519-N6)-dimethyltransferase